MQQIASALKLFHGIRVWIGDYLIMPHHLRALMTPANGHKLGSVLRTIKGYSATEINHPLRTNDTFWQRDSFDDAALDAIQLEPSQKHIRTNPGMADLAEEELRVPGGAYS